MRLPEITFDDRGLIPGIVQDAQTGRVLMLGYLNREAVDQTVATGLVHFWSRSRGELWRKGATSGNTLTLVDMAADCDGDTLLILARPSGPTCHTGETSCFGATSGGIGAATSRDSVGFENLDGLWSVIEQRAAERPEGSYTVRLIEGGVDRVARKVLEEAGEVLMAAKDHAAGTAESGRVAEEAADLMYHLLVLLAERSLDPRSVLEVLAARAR